MLQKFTEQIPAVILTAVLVIGAAFWLNRKTIEEMDAKSQAQLTALGEDYNAKLKTSTDDTRRQIQAVDTLLKDAIQKRSADVFMTDEEVAKLNAEKVNQLAEAIAKKVQPFNPQPKTPEEAERMQNEQVDKVGGRLADRITPIIQEMAKDGNLTRESIAAYSTRIEDAVGRVLTSELAKNQQLNNNLAATQAVADDSLKLAHQLTALYLSQVKDQGLITRLLSLPANVVRDASTMSLVTNSDRKRLEDELMGKMGDISKRLEDIRAQAPKR